MAREEADMDTQHDTTDLTTEDTHKSSNLKMEPPSKLYLRNTSNLIHLKNLLGKVYEDKSNMPFTGSTYNSKKLFLKTYLSLITLK